jgi:hypothetical protein
MATPDRESLANGLVSIGEDAIAKSNDALLDDYYTDDYELHSPAGAFNRDETLLRRRLGRSAASGRTATASTT